VPETWVVIPLYNEGAVIGDVVRELRKDLPDVVCVDDGSRDHSSDEARDAGAVVVRHAVNLGQGASLQTGLRYALRDPQMRYVVTFDADGQHRAEDAVAMVDQLRRGEADIIFGSRFLGERIEAGWAKRALLKTAVAYSNLTTHVRLTDAHNGLRAMNRTAAEALDIRQDRMAHASEIVSQVGHAKLRVAEHPVQILYTDYSKAKGQPMLNAINIVVDLLFK
jgi:glycosyltransferase involved in cell wall biosynthesis